MKFRVIFWNCYEEFDNLFDAIGCWAANGGVDQLISFDPTNGDVRTLSCIGIRLLTVSNYDEIIKILDEEF